MWRTSFLSDRKCSEKLDVFSRSCLSLLPSLRGLLQYVLRARISSASRVQLVSLLTRSDPAVYCTLKDPRNIQRDQRTEKATQKAPHKDMERMNI